MKLLILTIVLLGSVANATADQVPVHEALQYFEECIELTRTDASPQPTVQQCVEEFRNYVDGEP